MISTAEKLQHLVDLPTLPEIETTRTAPRLWEDLDAPPADDREVRTCDVDWDQLNMIEDATEGESISVWFIGTRREAWVARSLRQKPLNLHIREPPQHFVVIIAKTAYFQRLKNFSSSPICQCFQRLRRR